MEIERICLATSLTFLEAPNIAISLDFTYVTMISYFKLREATEQAETSGCIPSDGKYFIYIYGKLYQKCR